MKQFNMKEVQCIIDSTWQELKAGKKTPNAFLNERFEDDQSKSFPYYRVFYNLAMVFMPDVVVELGGCRGTASAHFAAGCKTANVISVDHFTDPGDDLNRQKMEACCAEFPNMRYAEGWTTAEYVIENKRGRSAYGDVVNALGGKKIDILFIDSWHQYEFALRDWNYYSKLVEKGGLVICDDLIGADDGPAIGGMRKFWNEIPGEEKILVPDIHPGYPVGFLKTGIYG